MTDIELQLLRLANPWLLDPTAFPAFVTRRRPSGYIPRRLPAADAWPSPDRAHVLAGARQVGKTTFAWEHLAARGSAPLFLNAEETWVRAWLASPTRALADLRQVARPGAPILIDEAQWLPEAGLLVKGMVDGGLPGPLYVTGSSSFHLAARTRESLAGRAARAFMHPLSHAEVCADLDEVPPLLRANEARARFLRLAVTGGYPAAWTSTRPSDVLAELVHALVLRDASDLFRVKDLDAFRRVLLLLAGQVGSLVNYAEWASICGVSRETVGHYVDILRESQIVFTVSPFAGGKRAEITGRSKIYFCDGGIRNAVVGQLQAFDERTDRGPVLEQAVAAEIRKRLDPLAPRDTLHFWRTKAGGEVDFVLCPGEELLGVEVKAAAMREPELSRSARSFIEGYAPRRFVVINLALDARERVGSTEVRWLPVERLAEMWG
ncbi:MAG: ATP-binding protein [Deltaproteobacteria bacterium]|nr:ATP-binding protein [Deltaproteobacteria bacterium]